MEANVPAARKNKMQSELVVKRLLQDAILRIRPDLQNVDITFTENSSTMVSRTQRGPQSVLRLHRIFRDAPEELLLEIIRLFFLRIRRRKATAIRARLNDFVQLKQQEILKPVSSRKILTTTGAVFDLQALLNGIESRFFRGIPPVQIAWSRKILKRLMAKWIENPDPLPNLVLINRLLDTPEVPEYYLEFLIFHELLHEVLPVRRSSGRWIHHPPEFRVLEREFPAYEQAQEWEKENLERLYRKAARAQSAGKGRGGKKKWPLF